MGTARYLAIVLLLATAFAGALRAETFIVNTTADAGDFDLNDGVADSDAHTAGNQVTLRCAIENANRAPDADEIRFDLPAADPSHRYYKNDNKPGSVDRAAVPATTADDDSAISDIDPDYRRSWWTIALKTSLPDITAPLTIDGYTQRGAQPGTTYSAIDAVLRVEIDGSDSSDAAIMAIAQRGDPLHPGLRIRADGCIIRGLAITRFNNNLSPGILIESSNNVVEGCFLGVEPSGLRAKPNYFGVQIAGEDPSRAISANRIGSNTADANHLAQRNLISGNYGAGVAIIGNVNGTIVAGNCIGTDRRSAKPIANGYGVIIAGLASGNRVGGAKAGDGNVISFNAKDGVNITGRDERHGTDNAVVSNFIEGNGGIGINLAIPPEGTNDVTANDRGDIDEGPNNLQNFPELSSATTTSFAWFIKSVGGTHVKGTLKTNPDTNYRVEFFANRNPDATGHGEGQSYLGSVDVNTGPTRVADLDFQVPASLAGRAISATATEIDANGNFLNTSEFAANVQVVDRLPAWLWLVVLGMVVIAILLVLRSRRRRRLPPVSRKAESPAPAA